VYFVGGLGNQLFQFSMLHYVSKKSCGLKVNAWLDRNPRSDRPFLLGEVFKICSHIGTKRFPYQDFRGALSRIVNFLGFRNHVYDWKIKVCNEVTQYKFISNQQFLQGRNKAFIGYFQNFRYVEHVWKEIKPELFVFLDGIKIDICKPLSYTVIHIRGGDFFDQKDSFGVLSSEYFKAAVNSLKDCDKSFIVVVTDDLARNKNIYESLKPNLIFGPADLNEWQTLKLMAMANVVITSNSTFSWWGGRLAFENGAEVVIPSPWFKNAEIGVLDAFEHPGFKTCTSSFQL